MPERGNFVKNCSQHDPHPERFNMYDTFDKSTLLTKNKRIGFENYQSLSERNTESLIKQGGIIGNKDVCERPTFRKDKVILVKGGVQF